MNKIKNTPWSRGGICVYGEDELSEGLYALEDEAVTLDCDDTDSKWIPYSRMQEVMILYRKRLRTHLDQARQEERRKLRELLETLKSNDDIIKAIKELKAEN